MDKKDKSQVREICLRALRDEASAILGFADGADASMERAVALIHQSGAPLIVAGIGKSGHIAGKIASTFRSIGRSAIFLHPGEASHGDLGLLSEGSVVLILSNSGETTELSDLLNYCKVHGHPVIALTSTPDSTLARTAEVTIAYGKVAEVCPNGLAPTTSTTLSLAIGDALAVGVTHLLGTAAEDFRRYHPGGKLGTMLLSVKDLMRTGHELPLVDGDLSMAETVVEMSQKGLGVAIVADEDRSFGIITDGDMRRHADTLWSSKAGDIATKDPITISPDMLAADALRMMSGKRITTCLVASADGRLAGLLHMHDVLRAGVVA